MAAATELPALVLCFDTSDRIAIVEMLVGANTVIGLELSSAHIHESTTSCPRSFREIRTVASDGAGGFEEVQALDGDGAD